MSGLTWARINTNLRSHPKVVRLLASGHPQRGMAVTSYVFSILWSVETGNDGHIPREVVGLIWGTGKTCQLLVDAGLFEPNGDGGWVIDNYAVYQELSMISEQEQRAASRRGTRANCVRWHGPDCWQEPGGCSRA